MGGGLIAAYSFVRGPVDRAFVLLLAIGGEDYCTPILPKLSMLKPPAFAMLPLMSNR
jgi:hypothetical protein